MKIKLPVLVLVLVVLPTAVLSLMASRALKNWELTLDRRLEAGAASAVQSVAGRMDGALEYETRQLTAALAGGLRGSSTPAAIEALVAPLARPGGLVKRVFLFMNPWGFLYPPGSAPAGANESAHEALVSALRRDLASMGEQDVRLLLDDGAYCFTPVPGRKGLYAGWEVDADVFRSRLTAMLAASSRGDTR